MRASDFLIDLNDIYGRLIPGMFLIADLYLIVNLFIPINHMYVLDYFKEYSSLSILFILIFFIVSHIIGELSLYPIFKFKYILIRETPLENLSGVDVTKEGDLKTFFESNFSKKALNSTKGSLMGYCKDYLLENSYQAYAQARKIEARINLKGGMIIPLIILTGICLSYQQWALSLLLFLLVVIFFDGFRKSFKGENNFVYKAYYHCSTNLHRLENQGKESHKPIKGLRN
jgi:hypothetical protein